MKFYPRDPKSLGHSGIGPNFSKIIGPKIPKIFAGPSLGVQVNQGVPGGRVDQVGQGDLCPQGLREARDFSETIGNHQG